MAAEDVVGFDRASATRIADATRRVEAMVRPDGSTITGDRSNEHRTITFELTQNLAKNGSADAKLIIRQNNAWVTSNKTVKVYDNKNLFEGQVGYKGDAYLHDCGLYVVTQLFKSCPTT